VEGKGWDALCDHPSVKLKNLTAIDGLEQAFATQFQAVIKQKDDERSVAHGQAVADAILVWAETDGYAAVNPCPCAPTPVPGAWEPTPLAAVWWYRDCYFRLVGHQEGFLQDDHILLGVSFIFPRCLSPPLPQQQVLHPIRKVLRRTSVSEQFQVPYTLSNSHLELMGIDHARKRHAPLLPLRRFA
jgi:hypothetical protein